MVDHLPAWARSPQQTGVLYLLHVDEHGDRHERCIDRKAGYLVGRKGATCDFVVDHKSASRVHCALAHHATGSLYLIDLSSTHGTFIQGQRLDKQVQVKLTLGTCFTVGTSLDTFTLVERRSRKRSASGDSRAEGHRKRPAPERPDGRDRSLPHQRDRHQDQFDHRANNHHQIEPHGSWGHRRDAVHRPPYRDDRYGGNHPGRGGFRPPHAPGMGRHPGSYHQPYAEHHRGMHGPPGYRGRGRLPPGRGGYTSRAPAMPPPVAHTPALEDRYNPAEDDRYQPPDAGDEPSELGEIGDSPAKGTSRSPSVEQQLQEQEKEEQQHQGEELQQAEQAPLPGISYSDADSEQAARSRSVSLVVQQAEPGPGTQGVTEAETALQAEDAAQVHSRPASPDAGQSPAPAAAGDAHAAPPASEAPDSVQQPESDVTAVAQSLPADTWAPDRQPAAAAAADASADGPVQDTGIGPIIESASASRSASPEQAVSSPAQLEQSKWASPEPGTAEQPESTGNGQLPGDQLQRAAQPVHSAADRHEEQRHATGRGHADDWNDQPARRHQEHGRRYLISQEQRQQQHHQHGDGRHEHRHPERMANTRPDGLHAGDHSRHSRGHERRHGEARSRHDDSSAYRRHAHDDHDASRSRRSRDRGHERSMRPHGSHQREADRPAEPGEADVASKRRKSAFDEAPAPGMPGAGLTPAQIVQQMQMGQGGHMQLTVEAKKKLLWGKKPAAAAPAPQQVGTEVYGANNWKAAHFDDDEERERFEKLMGVKRQAGVMTEAEAVASALAASKQPHAFEKELRKREALSREESDKVLRDVEAQYVAGLRRKDGRTVGLGL